MGSHKVLVEILVAGIESGLIHYLVPQLPAESGEGGSPCLVVVEVTGYDGIVRQDSQGFADIGDGVENHGIKAVIYTEAFPRKEVYESLEHVATCVAVGYMGNVFRRIRTLIERISQLKTMCAVLKADGLVVFAMKSVIDLHTPPLGYVPRNTTVGKVFHQCRRIQF